VTAFPPHTTGFPSTSSTVALGCFARQAATASPIGDCPTTMNILGFRASATRSTATTAAQPRRVRLPQRPIPADRLKRAHRAARLAAWLRPWRIKIVSSSALLTPSSTSGYASVTNHGPSPPSLRVPEVQAGQLVRREIVDTEAEAVAEVKRLDALNSGKGARYFFQSAKYFTSGRPSSEG
jgi:hypothetical protein